MEHGIAMEPMKGKWASYRVDLGYTELFCIPEVHQCPSRLLMDFWGTISSSIKQIKAPYLCDSELWIALHPMQGNESSSPGEGMCHGFSRVAAGTWVIFSS